MVPPEDAEHHPNLEACTSCGTLIDVSEQSTFDKVHCPSCGAAMRVRRMFNNYELVDVLGVGGMGTVYKAMDLNLHRPVALKVLKKEYGEDAGSLEELEREAKITASINHPHVVKVFSFGQAQGQLYFAMELVEKGSLDDLMMLQNRVPEIQVLRTGIQIAQGLESAYKVGLIHSDIKPGNILFADATNAKIVDFGLAILMSQEAEEKGEIWGTPYYVSPERLNKEPEDFRSDIYSLGGTLFHALAGRPPFEAETASLVALKHIKSKAVSLQAFAPDASSETAYVINRMVKRDPDERYSSYSELIEHLSYAHTKLSEATASGRRGRAKVIVEDERSKRLTAYLTLGLFAALLIVAVVVAFNWSKLTGTYEEKVDYKRPVAASTNAQQEEGWKEFNAALDLILKNEPKKARSRLEALEGSGSLTQPLKSWVTTLKATAFMLSDQPQEAREAFATLEKRGVYSMDPAQRGAAKFFVEAGKLLKKPNTVPTSVTRVYSSFQADALMAFLIGLHNWKAGNLDNGSKAFQIFLTSSPGEQLAWIDKLKPFAKNYVDDYSRYTAVKIELDDVNDEGDLKTVRDAIEHARKRLMAGSPLAPRLDALSTQVEKYIADPTLVVPARIASPTPTPVARATPTPAPTPAKPDPQVVAQETEVIKSLTVGYTEAVQSRDFPGFLKKLKAFKPTVPETIEQKAALQSKAEILERFFGLLIEDMSTTGFDRPIPRVNSRGIPGKVSKADRESFVVSVQYGSSKVSWSDITPRVMVGLAEHFAKTAPRGVSEGERHWLAGAFAYENGLTDIGSDLLVRGSHTNEAHKEQLDLFFSN